MQEKVSLTTHNGHPLTRKEEKFIQAHIEGKTHKEALEYAGYNVKYTNSFAHDLLCKKYIADEIVFRMEQMRTEKIASATEIMEYFTAVMRGEIKDQFGLDAPLSERTKAGQELAKRQIDAMQKLKERAEGEAPQLIVKLVRDNENGN